jgi:selenocysteine-specific elongation factor
MAFVVGTAGHVDHGKSTLVEALTGIDPDRLAEEKAREMTIDLGFAWLTLPSGESVGIIDVPGHRDFIENMLAGVGGIDLALFVIAADEGVMPQTREHLAILDLLGIGGGVVALTKVDLIDDPEWLALVTEEVSAALAGTVLADAPLIPVSARTGEGLDALVAALDAALSGSCPRPDRGRPRLPVDRAFTMSGFGTVVTGTLDGGSVHVGEEIEIQPTGLRARIRGLQSHKESIDAASPGSRVAINLSGVDASQVRRGDVVAKPGVLLPSRLMDVQFRHLAGADRPLLHNAEVKLFTGAAEVVAHVRLLGDETLEPGQMGWLQLRPVEAIAADRGDRFILRYPSPAQTIGGGVILDAHPPHRWRRFRPEVIARLETLAAGTPQDLVLQALEGETALSTEQVEQRTGFSHEEVAEALSALQAEGATLPLRDGLVMARAVWERLSASLTHELGVYHQHYPLRFGMPREELRSRLRLGPKSFSSVVALAAEQGLVLDQGTQMRLPSHEVRFSPAQQAAIDALFEAIRRQPTSPPSVKEAYGMVGEEVFQVLVARGDLVLLGADVFFDKATYAEMVQSVKQALSTQGPMTVAQVRDLFGTSRKYVLALLEHLDEAGVTQRVGDEHILKERAG